jgi:hypothetical protein
MSLIVRGVRSALTVIIRVIVISHHPCLWRNVQPFDFWNDSLEHHVTLPLDASSYLRNGPVAVGGLMLCCWKIPECCSIPDGRMKTRLLFEVLYFS